MEQKPRRAEAGAVTAGLHYTVDTGVKPVNETFGPTNIRRRVSGEHEVRQMTIRDGRHSRRVRPRGHRLRVRRSTRLEFTTSSI